MTPDEYIETMINQFQTQKDNLKIQSKSKLAPVLTMTQEEHLEKMLNILRLVKNCLDLAEYEFEIRSVKGEILRTEGQTLNIRQLEDMKTIIAQQIIFDEEDIIDIDMNALQEGLEILSETTGCNVLLLPPNFNVLVAKLKK